MINKLKNLGPGIIITSAFIGPGTVVAAFMWGGVFVGTFWLVRYFLVIVLQNFDVWADPPARTPQDGPENAIRSNSH